MIDFILFLLKQPDIPPEKKETLKNDFFQSFMSHIDMNATENQKNKDYTLLFSTTPGGITEEEAEELKKEIVENIL